MEYEKLIFSTECDSESKDAIIKNISIKTKLLSGYYILMQKIVRVWILLQILYNMNESIQILKSTKSNGEFIYRDERITTHLIYVAYIIVCLAILLLGYRKKKYF